MQNRAFSLLLQDGLKIKSGFLLEDRISQKLVGDYILSHHFFLLALNSCYHRIKCMVK